MVRCFSSTRRTKIEKTSFDRWEIRDSIERPRKDRWLDRGDSMIFFDSMDEDRKNIVRSMENSRFDRKNRGDREKIDANREKIEKKSRKLKKSRRNH